LIRCYLDLAVDFRYDFGANYLGHEGETTMMTMRLMRFGTKKKPTYRIVVMDSKRACQSQALDTLGTYSPLDDPAGVKLDLVRAKAWLAKGVRPSSTVQSLLDRVAKSTKPAQSTKS
jgi:small subunit ribosomal protein S16